MPCCRRYQATTWTYVNVSLIRFCGIHIRAVQQQLPSDPYIQWVLKSCMWYLLPHLPVAIKSTPSYRRSYGCNFLPWLNCSISNWLSIQQQQKYHEGSITPKRCRHGPLTRYVKLRVAHALGMPGTFSPPPRVSDPDMHHGTCVTHVPWCLLGSLTSGFLCSQRGKRFRHSRRMRNPQLYVSGKRPITGPFWGEV